MWNVGAKYYAALQLGRISNVVLGLTATPLQTSPKVKGTELYIRLLALTNGYIDRTFQAWRAF